MKKEQNLESVSQNDTDVLMEFKKESNEELKAKSKEKLSKDKLSREQGGADGSGTIDEQSKDMPPINTGGSRDTLSVPKELSKESLDSKATMSGKKWKSKETVSKEKEGSGGGEAKQSGEEEEQRTRRNLFIILALVVFCFVFHLTTVILYGFSINHFTRGIDRFSGSVDVIGQSQFKKKTSNSKKL